MNAHFHATEYESADCDICRPPPDARIVELREGEMLPREYHYGPREAFQHYDFPSMTWRPPGVWRTYNGSEPYFFVSGDGRDAQAHIEDFLARESAGIVFVYRSNGAFAAFRATV